MSHRREDVFRLPPLTMAEAKVVNTILQLKMLPDHETTPELMRKVKILDKQISTVMDLLDKWVVEVNDEDPMPSVGLVIRVMTHEEYKEGDWEDVDRFGQYDEERRGTVCMEVRWYSAGEESHTGYYVDSDVHETDDLKVVPDFDPEGFKYVLGFARSKGILGPDSSPRLLSYEPHPENGWLFKVCDAGGKVEYIQLTSNEAPEMGGLTARHVTPRGERD